MLLKFKLDKDGFRFTNPADLIAARSIDYIKCHFDIEDSTWANTDAIVAVFKSATYNKHAETLLDSNNSCFIDPSVYKNGGTIQVKLIGDKYQNEEVISSTTVTSILEFTINENVILPVTTPSMYAIIIAELEKSKAAVDQVLTDIAYKLAHGELTGTGIQDVVYNLDGTVTITLTDNTVFTSAFSLKGEKGDSGVYYGSEEPTDPEIDVWIDPDGESSMEPIYPLIEKWLDEHPEATTTVLDNSLTTAKYRDDSVTTDKLADGSVTTPKIADGAVTPVKLDRVYATPTDLSSVSTRVSQNSSDIDSLDTQFQQFIAPTGEAPNPAEITNARVGADGVTYTTLGDAIRTQVTDLKSEINAVADTTERVADVVDTVQDTLFDTVYYHPTWEMGVYAQNGFFPSYRYARAKKKFPKGKYTITPTAGYYFTVCYYVSDSSGTIVFENRDVSTTFTYTNDFYLSIRKADNSNFTNAEILDANSYVSISLLENDGLVTQFENVSQQVDEIEDYIGMNTETLQYVSNISTEVLKGLYVPNITGWTLYRVWTSDDAYRFGITLSDGETLILNGLSNVGDTYSDAVQKLVNPTTGEVVGYYVLHFTGEEYYKTGPYTPNETYTSSLDYNPIIKEYLERKENLVLIGDSIFGFGDENQLAPLLSKISKKKIFNCGFGGCTMVKQNSAVAYNPLTFSGVADSIASGDFTAQKNAIGLQSAYPYRYADLASVDWSKPTTIFVDYINNDITQNSPLGNLWAYTDTENDWDVYKFTEAMTYGLKKILGTYPHIRVVFFTSKWRFVESSGTLLPPYAYVNGLSLKAEDYNNALKENANRLGVSVYDFLNYGCSNAFNANYMNINGTSHFTAEGYEHFAELLNNLDKSFIM